MTVAQSFWNQIQSNDHRLMRRVHRWRAPRWFRILMIVATRGGDGWLWYALGLILVVFGGPHRFAAIGAASSAVVAGIFIFRTLKHASHRKRPCEIEPHCWAVITPPDRFSFPSGHAMTSFAIAIAVGSFYPQCQPSLLAVAAMIAVSRIIVGMHFLTDIIAGALIGALIGYLSVWLFL